MTTEMTLQELAKAHVATRIAYAAWRKADRKLERAKAALAIAQKAVDEARKDERFAHRELRGHQELDGVL